MSAYNRYRVPLCGPRTSVGTGKHRDRMQRLLNSPRQFIRLLARFLANTYAFPTSATAIVVYLLKAKRIIILSLSLEVCLSVCLLTLYRSRLCAICDFRRPSETHSCR